MRIEFTNSDKKPTAAYSKILGALRGDRGHAYRNDNLHDAIGAALNSGDCLILDECNYLNEAMDERNHTKGQPQPFPYWDGNPHHDARNIELHGMYHLFGGLLAERFLTALDKLGYADDLVPVADRRRQIAEIDAKLKELNSKRDGLANDLISSGMYE